MFVFGIDIPLVELIFAFTIIAIIILIEITIILILIAYQMKSSKKLSWEIRKLSNTLIRLEDKELEEINTLKNLEDEEKEFMSRMKQKAAGKIPHKIRRAAKVIIAGIAGKKPASAAKPGTIKHKSQPKKIIIKKPIRRRIIKQRQKSKTRSDKLKELLKDVDVFLKAQKK